MVVKECFSLNFWGNLKLIQWWRTYFALNHSLGLQDFGFLDPDPRGKISTKNCKKKLYSRSKPKFELIEKRETIKLSDFWMVHLDLS